MTNDELRKLFKKNSSLKITGNCVDNVWFWRDGELSVKEFYNLPQLRKLQHIDYLVTLGFENIGTNDQHILERHMSKIENTIPTKKHFLSLDIEVPPTLNDILTFED